MKTTLLLKAAIAILSTLLVWVMFFWQPEGARTMAPMPSLALAAKPEGGDFTLRGLKGPVSLAEYRGRVVVLYFGYSQCPDVCLTSLSLIAQAFSRLPAELQAQVQGLFISLDPERDTPERLASYAPFFHPRLLGLTGTPEEIAQVARRYAVIYRKNPKNAEGGYSLDHSSVTYIVAPDGTLAATLEHATPPERIAAAIEAAWGRR